MKVVLTLYILLLLQAFAFGQDLPNPPANIQTLPQDSYVIAMDNQWQATTGANPSFHYFNLKAYGLIVYLLNNNISVKRVIRSGKAKDDIDFSISCRQIKPTAETNPVVRNFKAGPFVIFGPDLLRVDINRLIDNFNNNYGGVSGIGSDTAKVRVYKTVADVNVDVRYDLTGFKPKASILKDGTDAAYAAGYTGSQYNYVNVQQTYMALAGVPITNYTVGANTDLSVNCFSFASEPHNDFQNATVANNIKNFVLAGGNFLAQCAAIQTYENQLRLQYTNGITWYYKPSDPVPSTSFFNADLNLLQFEGGFSISQSGRRYWQNGTSSLTNNAHVFVTGTINGTSLTGVSASKLTAGSAPGGMVYYLNNHEYFKTDDYNHINGIRMYLNALLTPPGTKNILSYAYNADCNAGSMKVASFNGPALAYPVDFFLYQDNGAIYGYVDPGDAFIGAATVPSPGVQKLIPLNGSDPNGDFVMKVVPNASCYKAEQVSPAPCRISTLSAALRNFTATRSGQQVLLRWQTLTEQSNDGFYIQRLVGSSWRDIGFVASSAPGGTSNGKLPYQFVTGAQSGVTQYRIRMQGLDKSVQYSEIRLVQGEDLKTTFTIYPNPSSSGNVSLFFAGAGTRSVSVYDISGRTVRLYEGITDASFDLAKLTTGMYLVKVAEANGPVQTQKLVVK